MANNDDTRAKVQARQQRRERKRKPRALGQAHERPTPKPPAPSRPAFKAPTAATKDTKGNADRKRASRFKQGRRFKRAVRDTYDEQDGAQKQRILKNSRGKVREAIKPVHDARVARNRELEAGAAGKDTKGDDDRARAERFLEERARRRKDDQSILFSTDRDELEAAGFKKDKLDTAMKVPGRILPTLAASAKQTSIATYEDPQEVIPKTIKGAAESVVSIPAAVVRMVVEHDPGAVAKGVVADYERRYGDVIKHPERFRERIKKEGAAPEVIDLASAVAASGASAGRGLQAAAQTGHLGKALERVATERAPVRVSGGKVVRPEVHANLTRNVAGHVADKARRARLEHRVKGDTATAVERTAHANDEVTFGRRKTARVQRRAVARAKGIGVTQMKAEQRRETRAAQKNIHSLSKPEQRAFKYAMQFGLPADAERAAEYLRVHLHDIENERQALEADGKATGRNLLDLKTDEVPEIEWLLEHADEAFTPELRRVVDEERVRAQRMAEGDPGIEPMQAELRRHAAQGRLLGISRRDGETDEQLLARIQEAREAAPEGAPGLEEPGYFPSERKPEGAFAAFALGGSRAVAGPQKYSGALLRGGMENADPEVFIRGLARNVKRKFNWNHVADLFDSNSFEWSRGRTLGDLKGELRRRGIDERSVAFWNPRMYREASQHARSHDEDAGQLHDRAVSEVDVEESPEVADALADAVMSPSRLATKPEEFLQSEGWSIVPKGVFDEIMADTKPSGAAGRGWDIAKGKASRVLLANPAWLQFQVGANALMAGFAMKGNVPDLVKAQLWWQKLTPEERDAVEPFIGVHPWVDDQRRLGAAADNRLVNGYRALKETAPWQAAHKANPLDAIFRADNAQNNLFRRAVLYNQVKRQAYKDMGKRMGALAKLQARMAHALSLGPDEKMREIIHNPEMVERHAEELEKFLGDYTTYTSKERRYFQRAVMFYGFLRFSLQFTFHTMPREHPLALAIGAQLGNLENEELNKLFNGAAPPWEVGNFFSRDGKQKLATNRMVPFFNAQQWQGPWSLASVLSPAAQIAVNQVAGKNVSFDKLYTVDGSTAYVTRGADLEPDDRLEIALGEALRLSPYFRALEKTGIPGVAKPLRGKQSSDSSLVTPQPVKYKDEEKAAENARKVAEQDDVSGARTLGEQFAPLVGLPFGVSQDARPILASSRSYQEQQQKAKGGTKKKSRLDRALERLDGADSKASDATKRIDRALKKLDEIGG